MYQWQSSPDNSTWTNIPGATLGAYSFTGLTANTYYRSTVTCPTFGTSTSSSTMVTFVLPPSSCTPTSANSCCGCGFLVGTTGQPFTVTGDGGTSISDATACGAGFSGSIYYYDQTPSMGCTFTIGSTYTATTGMTGSGNQSSTQLWIDYNSDGIFQTTESIGGQAHFTSVRATPTLTIPSGAGINPGVYRMRVVVEFDAKL